MRFEPLVTLWLLIPAFVFGVALITWQLMLSRKKHKKVPTAWILRAVLILFMFLTALGPEIPGATTSPGVKNLEVLFVVDTTSSMGATDYKDNQLRITGAKKDIQTIAKSLNGAYFGVITFDSKANVVLPLTSDNDILKAAVDSFNREVYGTSKGSAIDKPIKTMAQVLKDAKLAHPERKRVVFYLGDGEQTDGNEPKSFETLAKYTDGGGVLGYGTSKGSKMLRYKGYGDEITKGKKSSDYVNTFDKDTKKLKPAVSKLEEKALRKIAKDLKIPYENRNKSGPVNQLLAKTSVPTLIDKSKKVTVYLSVYWLFAIPFVVLLLLEWQKVLILLLEVKHDKRKAPHAK